MDSWSPFSIEPNDSSGQVDRSEEISSGLVVARSNCPVLLELATPSDGAPWTSPCQTCAGPFDCSWVGLRTVFLPQARVRSRAGRHRRLYPPAGFRPACEAAAHRLLPNHGLGPQSGKTRWDCPVRRPWRGFWYSSALAAPDRLVLAVFFWAPALCWCARTMVLSIMAYSLSASAARTSNTFFNTSLSAQRENRV